MLKELEVGYARVAWGIIPAENWCSGPFGGNRDEGDRTRNIDHFETEIDLLAKKIDEELEIECFYYEGWMNRIRSICHKINIGKPSEEEYWPEEFELENYFSEDEIYWIVEAEEVKSDPKSYADWDDYGDDGSKYMEKDHSEIPWFGIVDSTMNENEYKLLVAELCKILKMLQAGLEYDWD
jgi:hypothetical protein